MIVSVTTLTTRHHSICPDTSTAISVPRRKRAPCVPVTSKLVVLAPTATTLPGFANSVPMQWPRSRRGVSAAADTEVVSCAALLVALRFIDSAILLASSSPWTGVTASMRRTRMSPTSSISR